MKFPAFALSALLLTGWSASPSFAAPESGWKPLLDEKLTGWDVWIGPPLASVEGLPDNTPRSPDGHEGTPLGLNNDPKHVFSVQMVDGEPVLHITGEILGGLTSKETYGNFHLRAQFKWGELKWAPRLNDQRDSGILYHCTGKHGAFWNTWMRSLEFQVQEKDMGDLFLLAGTRADVAAVQDGKQWYFSPMAEKKPFGAGPNATDGSPHHLRGDFEKPHGEWNTLEIYTVGRDAVHVINGYIVNVLHNAANVEGPQSTVTPLDKGQLQIQSEGAENYYRRIEIEPISEFPPEIKLAAGQ
jgi:hypothetical protein